MVCARELQEEDVEQKRHSAHTLTHRLCTEGDGRHWYATIVSDAFEGKRPIARHQMVYATLGAKIQTDEVHALSMKTMTNAEWASHG